MKFDKMIYIRTNTDEERDELGSTIHEQLAGNPDYVENRIVLNIDESRTVYLYLDKDAKEITLKL